MDFENRNVLVTGGSSGIGYSTAAAFLRQGARVVITGSNSASVSKAVKELGKNALGVVADGAKAGSEKDIASFCRSQLGTLDVMVLNAGVCLTSNIGSLDESEFDREMTVNFKSAIFTVNACIPFLSDGGSILFTTSVNDTIGVPGQLVYSASKAALRSVVRTLAAELAPRGIRVNSVAPGPIDTPIFDKLSTDPAVVAKAKSYEAGLTVLKRMGRPEEIADAFVYLAGNGASYITAVNLRVDGGWGEI